MGDALEHNQDLTDVDLDALFAALRESAPSPNLVAAAELKRGK